MTIDLTRALAQAPPTPSKWSVIPIHTSDRATFKFCRRKWGWSSPSRLNLVPKPRIYGIFMPFLFGTGVHHALEKFYNPVLNEDPVVVWETWIDLQIKGGVVSEADIKNYGFGDREAKEIQPGVFEVVGLEELLPVFDHDMWDEVIDTGRGMMEFYKRYAQKNDNFSVIAVEHDFSVPVLHPDGSVLHAIDTRRIPESHIADGKYMISASDPRKEVHSRGRMDMIVQDNATGQYGIFDYKTAKILNDDYFKHLDLDEQVTTYMWAAESEAEMFDLPYTKLDFIVYQAMFKNYPKAPTMLKNGLPSIAKSTESTTAELFQEFIVQRGLQVIYDNDEKMQSYLGWLLEIGDERFVNRKIVRRNKAQKANCGERIYYEALDMLNPDIYLYPNPTKNIGCSNCQFRTPCVAMEDGSDWQAIIEDGFHSNYDR